MTDQLHDRRFAAGKLLVARPDAALLCKFWRRENELMRELKGEFFAATVMEDDAGLKKNGRFYLKKELMASESGAVDGGTAFRFAVGAT
jgi:hypothetical protein